MPKLFSRISKYKYLTSSKQMSKLLYPFLINEKFFSAVQKTNFRKSIVFEILKPRKKFYDYVSKLLFRFFHTLCFFVL